MSSTSRWGFRRVAAVFDFDPIPMGEGPSLTFRLEVYEPIPSSGRFFARVLRREHLRVLPSFSLRDGESPSIADEVVLVEDIQDFWESLSGASVDEVLTRVLEEIRGRFGVNV